MLILMRLFYVLINTQNRKITSLLNNVLFFSKIILLKKFEFVAIEMIKKRKIIKLSKSVLFLIDCRIIHFRQLRNISKIKRFKRIKF